MSFRSTARFGLLVVSLACLVAPLAGAQAPGVPTVTVPSSPIEPPSTVLDIHEGPFTFEGPANSPTHILVVQDGAKAIEYTVDTEGRARLDVAGENAIADATFVRIEGDPSGDAFALVLRDATGEMHTVSIDRVGLASNIPLPDLPQAPIAITRPAVWPGAPTKVYLLYVEDAAKNHLGVDRLDGSAFMQKSGVHRAVVQIPRADNQWDRWTLRAHEDGQNATVEATFLPAHMTDDAMVIAASFVPSTVGLSDGDRVAFDIIYEKRLSPLIVERFAEPATHKYRVDGTGPSVTLQAPAQADDFSFAVNWGGADALSGLGGFSLDYRESSSALWTHWLTTPATTATFSGDWGKTYTFRARSLDKVGNPSEEKLATTVILAQPAGSDDVNDPPTARFLTPTAGSALSDVVSITWEASDPDGTPVTSRLELSDDDGDSWRTLYVGPDTRAAWDTTGDVDGSGYRLRLTVSDGTQTASDVASALKVRNIIAPPAPAAPDPSAPATPGAPATTAPTSQPGASDGDGATAPASDDEAPKKGVPMVPLPLVGLAIVGAALLVARRRER